MESQSYKKQILEFEHYLIDTLDFHLNIFHPYKSLNAFLTDADLKLYSQSAHTIVNDSYYSDVIFQYPPYQIALAAIFITGNIEGVEKKLEKKVKAWFEGLNVSMKEIGEIVVAITNTYQLLRKEELKK
jgi:uncharacterized ubiquitin-like protein YukD